MLFVPLFPAIMLVNAIVFVLAIIVFNLSGPALLLRALRGITLWQPILVYVIAVFLGMSRLVPDWEPAQILAAVAEVRGRVGDDSHLLGELDDRGNALMQELKPRRGRRPRSAI